MSKENRDNALHYHASPVPGKIQISATKPLANQVDLSLAYSPGVAVPCEEIHRQPATVSLYTARANLVAVITNGTAVLGLGAIGPLASKPVMEGKGVLFKKFAGIDVFDLEIAETDPEKLVDIIASLEPTFGGINLEDIKAPECFHVERALRQRMDIPVFHDDQHGTAIIVGAAVINGLRVVDKAIGEVKLVASGAGAAGLACLDLLVGLGLKKDNISVCDIHGVVYRGREVDMDERKAGYARDTKARTLAEVIDDADIFLGVSAPGVLSGDMVRRMAKRPLILALANPVPEILPEEVRAVRDDAVIATGRSDYPNQVNNVLCFPYIFRGALDVGATTINEAMKQACVRAIADLATAEPSAEVIAAYGGQVATFGPDYLIPKPFDPRLITELPPAVAKAAMESGVATRPLNDLEAYRQTLQQFVFRTGMVMKPVFERARLAPKRVVYAEGEAERILRAVQVAVDDGIAHPVLLGRREEVARNIRELGLRLRLDQDFEFVDMRDNRYQEQCSRAYHLRLERQGVDPDTARARIRAEPTVLGAMLVHLGHADAMICGTIGGYHTHLQHVTDIIGLRKGVEKPAAMHVVILQNGTLFICDTHVNQNPDADEIADMTLLAAEEVRRFGVIPKVALLSHSNFGLSASRSARKMAQALVRIRKKAPKLEVEGEMQADAALSETLRSRLFPRSRLKGHANLLIMPNLDAANIAYNLLKMQSDGVSIGPILMGLRQTAYVLTRATTVRRIVNMTALATADADHLKASQSRAAE
jgi:malate dehydrogenase (oxaloacetate-decarboxylating)(NADP+)